MSAAYSPGPWVLEMSAVEHPAGYTTPFASIDGGDGKGAVAFLTLRPAQVEANARLIAAAPDLLSACEGLLACIDEASINAAIAAVSKATGGAA